MLIECYHVDWILPCLLDTTMLIGYYHDDGILPCLLDTAMLIEANKSMLPATIIVLVVDYCGHC